MFNDVIAVEYENKFVWVRVTLRIEQSASDTSAECVKRVATFADHLLVNNIVMLHKTPIYDFCQI